VTTVKPTPIDVDRILNESRWTGYQQWLVFLTAVTIIFDGFDNQLLGVALPTIMREWSVTRGAFAPVVSLGYLGMMIGGTLAGYAGDRIGRRNALLGCLALFGTATVVIAMVDDVSTLGILRLIAGVGLGGAMPNAAALAAEYVPLRQRPFAVTLTIVCVPLGATLAGFAAIAALPNIGWRGLFLIGGATPIAGAIVLRWLMPESPRYLVRHLSRSRELAALLRRMGHDVPDQATFVRPADSTVRQPSLMSIFGRELRVDTLALWAAFFSCLFAVYLGFAWLPTILTGAGLPSTVASSGLTAFNLGGVVGALVGGKLLTRFGSRIIMVGMTAGAVVCALVMSRMSITGQSAVLPILVMLTLTGGLINAVQTTMFALAAHVYPTAIRAGGVGTVVAFGRLGAILVGYAGPWALEYRGSESFFWLMAAALVVTCLALATVRRHVPGESRTSR
jgi:AAHS family 4-hydroxybenzoate transporter-like MFS transporter